MWIRRSRVRNPSLTPYLSIAQVDDQRSGLPIKPWSSLPFAYGAFLYTVQWFYYFLLSNSCNGTNSAHQFSFFTSCLTQTHNWRYFAQRFAPLLPPSCVKCANLPCLNLGGQSNFHASDMFRLAAKNTSEGSHCKIRIACENRLAELVQGTGSGG